MSIGVDQTQLVAAAHHHLERGFHPFPVDHPDQPTCIGLHGPEMPCDSIRGKHPAVKFGTWATTVTPQMIDLGWQTRGRLANIGIACGPSGLVVLDEDLVGELDRWAATQKITLPPTYTVATDRGEHRYYLWDHAQRRIGNSSKALKGKGFKIDVRGHGGYVLGAGSKHATGTIYTAANDLPVAPLPHEVADLLLAGTVESNPDHRDDGAFWEPTGSTADPNATQIASGGRHSALVAYAGRLRSKDLDYPEAEAVYYQRWLLCEQPVGQIPEAKFHDAECPYPVTWEEARGKLRDVFGRYPAGEAVDECAAEEAQKGASADEESDRVRAFRFSDDHRPTDVGNAARLLECAGGRIRYVHAWGKWIVYLRGRWIIDEKDALVTEIAKKVARRLYKLAAKTAATEGPDEAKLVWDWALHSDTSGAISAMIRLARGAPGILVNHEDLDADPWVLNVANGTVDLKTGHLRSHDPADLCTLQSPVAYDPHASAPLWARCVERWQPDDAVRDYIQMRAGASATGIPTETVDVDYGDGGNGKSKFHGAIQSVLGPYATIPHKSLLVAGRFEQHATVVADLFRKRCAVASETKQAEAFDDESVKNLTGGDRLKGRRMREDPWEFWPTHTLIMASNHKPTVQGRDEGIWRRLRLVPWQVTIHATERDEHLASKLQAEAPGILKWIIDGAVRYAREGLTPPPAVLDATSAYRAQEDVLGRFLSEVLEFAPHTWSYSCDIAAELDDWAAEQGIAAKPRMHEIAATLRGKGCKDGGRKQVHGKRSTIWHGVSIASGGTYDEGKTP